jgi:hypothetical protein
VVYYIQVERETKQTRGSRNGKLPVKEEKPPAAKAKNRIKTANPRGDKQPGGLYFKVIVLDYTK